MSIHRERASKRTKVWWKQNDFWGYCRCALVLTEFRIRRSAHSKISHSNFFFSANNTSRTHFQIHSSPKNCECLCIRSAPFFSIIIIPTRRHRLWCSIFDTVLIFSWKYSLILFPSSPHSVSLIYKRFIQCDCTCLWLHSFSLIYFLFLILCFFLFPFQISSMEWNERTKLYRVVLSTGITWFVKPLFEKRAANTSSSSKNFQGVHAEFDLELLLTCRQPVTKCWEREKNNKKRYNTRKIR